MELDFTLVAGCWLSNDVGRSLPQQEEQEVPPWRYHVSLWSSNPAAYPAFLREFMPRWDAQWDDESCFLSSSEHRKTSWLRWVLGFLRGLPSQGMLQKTRHQLGLKPQRTALGSATFWYPYHRHQLWKVCSRAETSGTAGECNTGKVFPSVPRNHLQGTNITSRRSTETHPFSQATTSQSHPPPSSHSPCSCPPLPEATSC